MSTAMTSLPGRKGLPRPRVLGILLAAVIVVAVTYVSTGARQAAPTPATAPAHLSDPTTIDSTGGAAGLIAASTAQIDQGIKVWSANLAKEPRDFFSATTLASLYYSRGRLSGDLADEQKALQLAQTAVTAAPTEPGGRAMEAAILYYLHDFAGAQTKAAALYKDDPTQLGALATMADATLELGDIAGARADYDSLRSSPRARRSTSGWLVSHSSPAATDQALALATQARDEATQGCRRGRLDRPRLLRLRGWRIRADGW